MALSQMAGVNAANGNPVNAQTAANVLATADAVAISARFTKNAPFRMKAGETANYPRAVTPDATGIAIGQGVNPTTRAIVYENATVVPDEFAEAFGVTSRQNELGELDYVKDSKDRLADLVARNKELNFWFKMRACNNSMFTSTAITSKATVNGVITKAPFNRIARLFATNRAKYYKQMTKGSMNQGTAPVAAAYMVLGHTDARQDYYDMADFIPAHQIGGAAKDLCAEWIGNVGEYMIVLSPEYLPELGIGAAVGATGMKSVGGTNIDVYTSFVFGLDALYNINIRGGFNSSSITVLDKPDKADPTNATVTIATRYWDAPFIGNQNWCAAIHHAVSA